MKKKKKKLVWLMKNEQTENGQVIQRVHLISLWPIEPIKKAYPFKGWITIDLGLPAPDIRTLLSSGLSILRTETSPRKKSV